MKINKEIQTERIVYFKNLLGLVWISWLEGFKRILAIKKYVIGCVAEAVMIFYILWKAFILCFSGKLIYLKLRGMKIIFYESYWGWGRGGKLIIDNKCVRKIVFEDKGIIGKVFSDSMNTPVFNFCFGSF